MRIVVFSDSHNNFYALKGIVRAQRSADVFLHLGDGERDFDDLVRAFPNAVMYNVRGNCDWASTTPFERTIILMDKKIYMAHGHLLYVKSNLDQLKAHGRAIGADIVLFGHTHQVHNEYDDGIYYMNPGSVTSPGYGGPSYGVIDITDAGVFVNIVQF